MCNLDFYMSPLVAIMKRLIIISICSWFFSVSAQTIYDLKEQYIIRLTTMINPNKDSIQKIKLKDIRTIHFNHNKTDTTITASFDRNGNVLTYGNYSFKYDTSNKVKFIRYYWSSTDEGQGFDSIDLTKKLDTNKVFDALGKFSKTFYDKAMTDIYKMRKKMAHYDSLKFKNAHINIYCPITNQDTTRYISNIIFQSFPHPPREPNIIESVKYDYGYHPPTMEITRHDTLNKVMRSFNYSYPENGDKNLSYTYRLRSIFTSKKYPDYIEYIYENYMGKDDKIFDFPQFIDIDKVYKDYKENYYYKKSSPKKQKLIEYSKIMTYKTYYK